MQVNFLELVLLILFFSAIIVRLFQKKMKKEIEIRKLIILEYSKKYSKKLQEIAQAHEKSLKIIGLAILISAPILLIIGVYNLFVSLIFIKPSVALVLPAISGVKYPGPVLSVPFWIWIIAIFLIVFSHESFHALMAMSEKIKTRRYGILYLLFIPLGAFVDIDEKKLEKLRIENKIKILAAGSFGNLLLFGIFTALLLLSSYFLDLLFESRGVWFNSTAPNTPAERAGLEGIILKIDNTSITNVYDLQEFLKRTRPNTTVLIETTKGKYELTLSERNNVSYIGIVDVRNYIVYRWNEKPVSQTILLTIGYFQLIFRWISFLSLGVAIANMLPILPLDGGLIMREILKDRFGKKGEKFSYFLSTSFLLLLLFSLFLSSLTLQAAF
jgi:membrane-associated protease RseP (regulator of RpoE activity)